MISGLFSSSADKARSFLGVVLIGALAVTSVAAQESSLAEQVEELKEEPAPEDEQTVLELAMELLELNSGDVTPDPIRLLSTPGASRHAPLFRRLISQPLGAPYRVGVWETSFRERDDSIHRMMLLTATLTGAGISRGYFGNPFQQMDMVMTENPDVLEYALGRLGRVCGDPTWKPVLPTLDELPEPLRLEVARVIMAISSAEQFRQRALRKLPEDFTQTIAVEQIVRDKSPDFGKPDWRLAAEDVEMEALFAGMFDIVAAAEDFDEFLSNRPELPEIHWDLETPLGLIIINTKQQDDEYLLAEAPLFAFDAAGSDVWRIADFDEERNGGISFVYDQAGDDEYDSGKNPGFSAGILGYGLQIDKSGNDTYKGEIFHSASALFGAAMLVDDSGDDIYEAGAYAQSYAIVGSSLLVDRAGTDKYSSIIHSQASAESLGAALLYDKAGNDEYLLTNEPLIRPSAQSPAYNLSMGQGTAAGYRASLVDGRSLAGGVAILIDSAGDDMYQANVFCQGTGYLESLGLLIDGDGSDEYRGVWYAQGSAAHSAFGGLLDRGNGDDIYWAEVTSSIAMAHDISAAFLYDEGGNDKYRIENGGIGMALQNSTSLMVDESGDDTYETTGKGVAVGAAKQMQWGTMREVMPNVCMFFDLGGRDSYKIRSRDPGNYSSTIKAIHPGDGRVWTYTKDYPDLDLASEKGVGIDGEYETPFNIRPRTESDDYDKRMLTDTQNQRRQYRQRRQEYLASQAEASEPAQ